MENTKMNEIVKYSYLLDQDNLIIENKVFIDMMWIIAKETFTKPDKNGKPVLKTKSYVIRNSASMFQQIFYWHLQYLKKDKQTTYQYKNQNVIKMDFEDWWNSCRLSDVEITSGNKFLTECNLVKIVKMRIKEKDKEVYKPCNCYLINYDVLEKYLNNIIEINSIMYKEKVDKVRKANNETSIKAKLNLSTDLSTENGVTPLSQVTSKINGYSDNSKDLSTLSTEKKEVKDNIIPSVTPLSQVTEVTPLSQVTEVTPLTHVTNKSNTSYTNTSYTNTSEREKRNSSSPLSKDDLFNFIKSKTTEVGFNTWFKSGIEKLDIKENTLEIEVINDFTKEILQTRYLDLIKTSVSELSNKEYQIVFI